MAKCTICSVEIRTTKKNIEAKTHFESRHPTSTFATCFPGAFDPTVAGSGAAEETAGEMTAAPVTAAPAVAPPKKKKPAEDLSFLSAALDSKEYKKK
jgi:hypothetical protein